MKYNISEIQIIPTKARDGLVGFASFVFNEAFYIGSIGIYTRLNGDGYRLTYPTRKRTEGSLNICHPINREIALAVEKAIIEKYESLAILP